MMRLPLRPYVRAYPGVSMLQVQYAMIISGCYIVRATSYLSIERDKLRFDNLEELCEETGLADRKHL